MPRVIENLKDRILEEACTQIEQHGYGALTMRSIAKSCGVAVGTVYNYYGSKDDIMEAYLFRKWDKCIQRIYLVTRYAQTYHSVIHCIYDEICAFSKEYSSLLRDEDAVRMMESILYRFQGLLCRQLAQPLRQFCESEMESEIIAEALMMWIQTGKSYEEIEKNISKLFEG